MTEGLCCGAMDGLEQRRQALRAALRKAGGLPLWMKNIGSHRKHMGNLCFNQAK